MSSQPPPKATQLSQSYSANRKSPYITDAKGATSRHDCDNPEFSRSVSQVDSVRNNPSTPAAPRPGPWRPKIKPESHYPVLDPRRSPTKQPGRRKSEPRRKLASALDRAGGSWREENPVSVIESLCNRVMQSKEVEGKETASDNDLMTAVEEGYYQLYRHLPAWISSGLSNDDAQDVFHDYMSWKTSQPVRGAIILSEDLKQVLLVLSHREDAQWMFPRGKIEKHPTEDRLETDEECFLREIEEEVGYDASHSYDKNVFAELTTHKNQHIKMYYVSGVPTNSVFRPKDRNEVWRTKWFPLEKLPAFSAFVDNADFYMVKEFMPQLKEWLATGTAKQKRLREMKAWR